MSLPGHLKRAVAIISNEVVLFYTQSWVRALQPGSPCHSYGHNWFYWLKMDKSRRAGQTGFCLCSWFDSDALTLIDRFIDGCQVRLTTQQNLRVRRMYTGTKTRSAPFGAAKRNFIHTVINGSGFSNPSEQSRTWSLTRAPHVETWKWSPHHLFFKVCSCK